jgi:mRNA-degrading endonuclease toxin of MazEF toxin-antitoxin module
MKKYESIDDIIAVKKSSIRFLNNTIEYYLNDGNNPRKAQLICKWLKEFSNYIRFEDNFDATRNIAYHRGDIIKVNFGFNIGSELGGVHYAIVIDNNNLHNSETLTVVPMSSFKPDKQLYPRDIYIGSEFYSLLHSKVARLKREVNEELVESKRMSDALNDSFDSLSDLKLQLKSKQKALQDKLQYCNKCADELSLMKGGSVIKVEQIRTVSKIRIWDPKNTHDVLYGIKLSDATMNKISVRIKELFVH